MGQRCSQLPTEINTGGLQHAANCWQQMELFGWGAAHSVSSLPKGPALVSLFRFPNLYSATPTITITDTVFSIIGQSMKFSGLMFISVHAILRQS